MKGRHVTLTHLKVLLERGDLLPQAALVLKFRDEPKSAKHSLQERWIVKQPCECVPPCHHPVPFPPSFAVAHRLKRKEARPMESLLCRPLAGALLPAPVHQYQPVSLISDGARDQKLLPERQAKTAGHDLVRFEAAVSIGHASSAPADRSPQPAEVQPIDRLDRPSALLAFGGSRKPPAERIPPAHLRRPLHSAVPFREDFVNAQAQHASDLALQWARPFLSSHHLGDQRQIALEASSQRGQGEPGVSNDQQPSLGQGSGKLEGLAKRTGGCHSRGQALADATCSVQSVSREKLHRATTIGARLKEARESASLRKVDLARKTGLSLSQVGRIESGKSQPSPLALNALAQALGIERRWLLTGEGDAAGAHGAAERVASCLISDKAVADADLESLLGLVRQIYDTGDPEVLHALRQNLRVFLLALRSRGRRFRARRRLGEILVGMGAVTKAQVDLAVNKQLNEP